MSIKEFLLILEQLLKYYSLNLILKILIQIFRLVCLMLMINSFSNNKNKNMKN